jgi:ribonuclease G
MERRLIIETGFGETRAALTEDGRLVELRVGRTGDPAPSGSLHLGRVLSVDPALDAAFVDLGLGRPGLLPLRDAGKASPSDGETVLVQVTRAATEEKGPRLSARLALPGRGLTLRPGRPGLAFASTLADPEDRERIAGLLKPVSPREDGVLVDGGAAALAPPVLKAEFERLTGLWNRVKGQAGRLDPPSVLWAGEETGARALLDWAAGGLAEIVVSDRAAGVALSTLASERLGDAVPDVTVATTPGLFEAEGIEEAIEAALVPEVPLEGGGYLLIEQGRTLTAIDVNSGGGESGRPRRPREANAVAIARELRLRAIGGLVVIDFIDLKAPSARGPVIDALKAALAVDPVGAEVAGVTRLGLVELTRRRTGPSLMELLTEPAGIGGGGRVRRLDWVARELLRRAQREARANPGRSIGVTASPAIAGLLDGALKRARDELERRLGRPLDLVADPSQPRDGYHMVVR